MTNVNIGEQIGQQKNTAIANFKEPFCSDIPDSSAMGSKNTDSQLKTIEIDPRSGAGSADLRSKVTDPRSGAGSADLRSKATDPRSGAGSTDLRSKATDPRLLSDDKLFLLCQQYGNNAKMWKRKFEELLPEVMKRGLYRKKRFISIYEFAAKVAGLSYDSVDEVLRVYKQLEDKPKLRALVVEFGWSKLRIVSGIATVDTDESWAEKVRVLPKSSLETLVRDFRRQDGLKNGGQSAIKALIPKGNMAIGNRVGNTPDVDSNTDFPGRQVLLDHGFSKSELLPGEEIEPEDSTGKPIFGDIDNGWPIMSFKVDPETEFRLRKLKLQIEKERKFRLSFNQFFKIIIERAEGRNEGSSAANKNQISARKETAVTNANCSSANSTDVNSSSANNGLNKAQKDRLAERKIQSVCDESAGENEEYLAEKKIKSADDVAAAGDRPKPAINDRPKPAINDRPKPPSRHIPNAIKKFLARKYQGRCGFPGCEKPSEVFHHVQRFALAKTHNPGTIVPLCKEHHDVAHGGWIGNEQDRFGEDVGVGSGGAFGGGEFGGGKFSGGEFGVGGAGREDVVVSGDIAGHVGMLDWIDPDKWEVEHDIKRFLSGYSIDEIVRGCRGNWEKRRLSGDGEVG